MVSWEDMCRIPRVGTMTDPKGKEGYPNGATQGVGQDRIHRTKAHQLEKYE